MMMMLLWVQVDAQLLRYCQQKLFSMTVLLRQIPYFSGELLCLCLHLFNGGLNIHHLLLIASTFAFSHIVT